MQIPKLNIGRPQNTSMAGVALAFQQILTNYGDKTIWDFLSSIPSMNMLEMTGTLFPLALAVFLFLFNEDKPDEVIELTNKV